MRAEGECTSLFFEESFDGRFVIVFILLHVMVYAFGFMNYGMKVVISRWIWY